MNNEAMIAVYMYYKYVSRTLLLLVNAAVGSEVYKTY